MCTDLNRTGARYYFRRAVPKDLVGFFLTATGKPRVEWKFSLGVTDRTRAKELLRPVREEIDGLTREAREQLRRARGCTVEELIEAYEADKSPGWSGSSKKAVLPVFRLLRDVFAGREVGSITREAVQKGKAMGLPTIQPKTINDGYLLHIASMFNWAQREQWIASSPFSGLSVHEPRE